MSMEMVHHFAYCDQSDIKNSGFVSVNNYPKNRVPFSEKSGIYPAQQSDKEWIKYFSFASQSPAFGSWSQEESRVDFDSVDRQLKERLSFGALSIQQYHDLVALQVQSDQLGGSIERFSRNLNPGYWAPDVPLETRRKGEQFSRTKIEFLKQKIKDLEGQMEVKIHSFRSQLSQDQQNAFIFWIEEVIGK